MDFADAAIASGQETARALRLTNLQLDAADLLDWDPGVRKFDYIICHGFYSWVPAAIRERLMDVVGSHLSEHGIAYISYNTYPGCHVRQILAGMMRYHTRRFASPQQRVAQAKEVAKLLKLGAAGKKHEVEMLRAEADLVLDRSDEVLFHDDLAGINDPVYFHEFMAHAGRFGLEFLGEAEFVASTDSRFPEEVRGLLAQMDAIEREQYMDFLKCRRFRATLLVRAGTQFREVDEGITRTFLIASPLKPSSSAPKFEAGVVEEFSDSRRLPLHLDHPLSNAALVFLSTVWPKAISFDAVVAGALKLLGSASIGEDHLEALQMVLFRAYAAGLIEFHTFQPEITTIAGERPVASPLVRYQARRREPFVTGLQHKATKLDNELAAAVLALLDGTRDRDALRMELEAQKRSGELHIGDDVSITENLDAILRQGAEQGLLIS